MSNYTDDFFKWLQTRAEHQPDFIRVVKEFCQSVNFLLDEDPEIKQQAILYRLAEPDRIISFRVVWTDDQGQVQVNRGWRVQHCGAVGPYKGGLRFHPQLNESILKFLAFEQTFKNALTGLPIGGAKGGADFDPKGRSDNEIMHFCQAFMTELYRHIGENTDVPAGDINVSQREIGYLFGQYRRITNEFTGTLTGKHTTFGGSEVRMEATGFGLIYFLEQMLKQHDDELRNKRVAISGSGNVAVYAALKATQLGATVICMSSSQGAAHFDKGLDYEQLKDAIDTGKRSTELLKNLVEHDEQQNSQWCEGKKSWHFEFDIALPCATQNELDAEDAKMIVNNQTQYLAEGANMPCTFEANEVFNQSDIIHAPGKASNAGGVALSTMEMMQNASFETWDYQQLDDKLKSIMKKIHQQCVDNSPKGDRINYQAGANIASFKRIASVLIAQGHV